MQYFLTNIKVKVLKEIGMLRCETGSISKYNFAQGRRTVTRSEIINHMIIVYGYKRYLEIGVCNRSFNFNKINIDHKEGVDPDPAARADHVMTSDAFFSSNREKMFDIVFIDGLHTGEQVAKDIENALNVLVEGGTILLHDMNPPTAFHAREEYDVNGERPVWNGTSWRGFAQFRATRPDLDMCVVDADWGVGVIKRGSQTLYNGPWRDYEDLARDRRGVLNLVTVQQFLRAHPRRS